MVSELPLQNDHGNPVRLPPPSEAQQSYDACAGGLPLSDITVYFVSHEDLLSSAIATALTNLGWQDVQLMHDQQAFSDGWIPRLQPAARQVRGHRLVLLADREGKLPTPQPELLEAARENVIVLGGRESYVALALAIEKGARAALNVEQPFSILIRKLHEALAHPCPGQATALAVRLRQREAEARMFAVLSDRELDVLAALLEGCSAAKIAATEHVAMSTIRSHIRAILTKLGVSSQLAAVAMAYRSCREVPIITRIHSSINSYSDMRACLPDDDRRIR